MKAANKQHEEIQSPLQQSKSSQMISDNPHQQKHMYQKIEVSLITFLKTHAVFGSLLGPGKIERFDCYKRLIPPETKENDNSKEITLGIIKVGNKLNGHEGIIHGGIVSLLFDEVFGFGVECLYDYTPQLEATLERKDEKKKEKRTFSYNPAFTANLNVQYRQALKENTTLLIRVFLIKTEGRKIYLRARMEGALDGDEEEVVNGVIEKSMERRRRRMESRIVYAEATCLYIRAKESIEVDLGSVEISRVVKKHSHRSKL